MIHWKDFIFDEVLGFILRDPDQVRCNSDSSMASDVMEDSEEHSVQETTREQLSARMAGSTRVVPTTGMEAGQAPKVQDFQLRRKKGGEA